MGTNSEAYKKFLKNSMFGNSDQGQKTIKELEASPAPSAADTLTEAPTAAEQLAAEKKKKDQQKN